MWSDSSSVYPRDQVHEATVTQSDTDTHKSCYSGQEIQRVVQTARFHRVREICMLILTFAELDRLPEHNIQIPGPILLSSLISALDLVLV